MVFGGNGGGGGGDRRGGGGGGEVGEQGEREGEGGGDLPYTLEIGGGASVCVQGAPQEMRVLQQHHLHGPGEEQVDPTGQEGSDPSAREGGGDSGRWGQEEKGVVPGGEGGHVRRMGGGHVWAPLVYSRNVFAVPFLQGLRAERQDSCQNSLSSSAEDFLVPSLPLPLSPCTCVFVRLELWSLIRK